VADRRIALRLTAELSSIRWLEVVWGPLERAGLPGGGALYGPCGATCVALPHSRSGVGVDAAWLASNLFLWGFSKAQLPEVAGGRDPLSPCALNLLQPQRPSC